MFNLTVKSHFNAKNVKKLLYVILSFTMIKYILLAYNNLIKFLSAESFVLHSVHFGYSLIVFFVFA